MLILLVKDWLLIFGILFMANGLNMLVTSLIKLYRLRSRFNYGLGGIMGWISIIMLGSFLLVGSSVLF